MDSRTLLTGLAGLAEQRTSPRRALRFQKHLDAYAEIERLEGLLGVAHSKPESNNITSLNARAAELERMVTESLAKTPPAAAVQREAFPGAAIIASLEAITDPADRTEFFRANSFAINRFYRDAPEGQSSYAKPTGIAVIDAMASLNGQERVRYYRIHKAAIDAAYTALKKL